jgi:hypothetical protein
MNDLSWFWTGALGAVSIYCAVQAVRDFRAKRYAWAAAAAISAVLLLAMPVKSHVIKIDLPIAN